MMKYKNIFISALIIIAVLTVAFWWGGDAPGLHGFKVNEETSAPVIEAEKEIPDDPKTDDAPNEQEQSTVNTDVAPVEQTEPANDEVSENDNVLTCTISVTCKTILDNLSWLDDEKVDIIPKDGVILAQKTVTFNEGESAFNVLQRELKREKIHLEFSSTPVFNSVYLEGINNIYEFDCGENSGWMYKVNGEFPNYGCSRYEIQDNDNIEWIFTCNLGKDIGGDYAAQNQRI